MKLNRRRFLGFTVGATAGVAAGVPASRTLSELVAATDSPIYPPRGPEDFVLSVCRMCPGGCGLRVRRIGGRPVKVDGNPLHPINGGRLCPKGQASLQSFLHPDRIQQPMRRIGPRGSISSFEVASWDEALSAIAERLKLLRQVGRPESLALLRGSSRGLGARVAQRFMRAFGSPNDISIERGEAAAAQATYLTQGVHTAATFDVKSTDYILSFGSALLESWSSPVHMMRAYGDFRQGRPGRRGKLVHLEPRLSITGSSADEWIGIRPGTEGIVALGIAQILLAEDLFDQKFVYERCAGFLDSDQGSGSSTENFRSFMEENFSLERVTATTGVSGDTLLRLAREFADARVKLAVGPKKGPLLPGSLFDHLAVQMLNALVGNIDGVGGSLLPEQVPLGGWPDLPDDPVSARGLSQPRLDRVEAGKPSHPTSDPERLAQEVFDGPLYPLQVLLILDADPAFGSMAPDRFAQAIEKIPLVVTLSSMPDDTSLLADWILPQTHFLETWDLDLSPPGIPYPLATLGQPITDKPLYDGRPAVDIFLEISRRVGGVVAEALPWPSLESLLRVEVDNLFAARRGSIMGTEFDEAWVRMMERAGWWTPGYSSREELWQRMQETGGWWDPFYDHGDWNRVLKTKSGRFEFRADLLRSLLAGKLLTMVGPPGERSPSPDEPWINLLLFEPLAVSGGIGSELPFLQELLDPGLEERWETWGEIHPETAEQLGIKDREWVELTSDEGAIRVRARVTPRVVVDAVAVPLGLGKKGGGRWASGRGSNPLRLLSPARELLSGLPDLRSIRVRVTALERSARRWGKRS